MHLPPPHHVGDLLFDRHQRAVLNRCIFALEFKRLFVVVPMTLHCIFEDGVCGPALLTIQRVSREREVKVDYHLEVGGRHCRGISWGCVEDGSPNDIQLTIKFSTPAEMILSTLLLNPTGSLMWIEWVW